MIGWHSGLALFLTEVGRYDEARDELRRLVVQGGLELARPNEWYAVHAALALASGELGASDIAVKLYPVLLPYASGMTVVGYCSYSLGSTQRLLGVLAATLGEWDLARTHFEAAISTNGANGAVACNGRVYLEYAQMLFARGDLQAGMHRAMQAMEIASRFGMQRLTSRIEARIPASA
jgi:tetratricopeptide (TPR) repeat protein